VYEMVMKVLQEYNMSLGQMIGVCSDGASTMRGVHKGVCTQLERHLRQSREATIHNIIAMQDVNSRRSIASFHESRGIFTIHCVCHRLALVLTDAIKGTKNEPKVIPETRSVLNCSIVCTAILREALPEKKKCDT